MIQAADSVQLLRATMETFADAKRFNERWHGDSHFRSVVLRDPQAGIDEYNLRFNVDELRGMLAGDMERAGSLGRGVHAIAAAKSALMKQWYGADATASDPRITTWRERRHKRMALELGPFPANSAVRAAWRAELTEGCSGGCWFCSMAAQPLTGVAPSDTAALSEWRSIVRTLQERLGPAMRTGFLDGATDPFDHPEYETFCSIVREEAGYFPSTATALVLRDPERSRRFFADAKKAGSWSIRLTVRSLDELNTLHSTFTSDELAHVQLNVMIPESPFVYSLTGRYRERYLADASFAERERRKLRLAPWYTVDPSYRDAEEYPFDGNTGLIGFGLNMVERTVSLVAPRQATDHLPLGFETLETRTFFDASDLASSLDQLVERWMPTSLRESDNLAFWTGLRLEHIDGGVRFHGRFRQWTDVVGTEEEPLIHRVSDDIEQTSPSLRDLMYRHGSSAPAVRDIADRMYSAGLLDEVGHQ